MIRHLGELGPTWTHQWSDTGAKALKNIKLPLDQSKKIFKESQLAKLFAAVDVAVDETKPDLRSDWKLFLTHYVKAIEILTKSVEYASCDIDVLEEHIDVAYTHLMRIAGIQGVTNYFHYLGSGHIVWLIRMYGNIWRYRNEGVEGLNGTLSLRYNKFNNKGGNKGSRKNKLETPNRKCWAFEVLGSWMARLCMWQLGLGLQVFEKDSPLEDPTKVVKWRTGPRLKYRKRVVVDVRTDVSIRGFEDGSSDDYTTDSEADSTSTDNDSDNSDHNYNNTHLDDV